MKLPIFDIGQEAEEFFIETAPEYYHTFDMIVRLIEIETHCKDYKEALDVFTQMWCFYAGYIKAQEDNQSSTKPELKKNKVSSFLVLNLALEINEKQIERQEE